MSWTRPECKAILKKFLKVIIQDTRHLGSLQGVQQGPAENARENGCRPGEGGQHVQVPNYYHFNFLFSQKYSPPLGRPARQPHGCLGLGEVERQFVAREQSKFLGENGILTNKLRRMKPRWILPNGGVICSRSD